MPPFNFSKENFLDVDFSGPRGDIRNAQIGLLALSEETDHSTYLYVTEINDYAYETMRKLIPHGETHNLRSSVRRYGQAVPGALVNHESRWLARTYIDDKAVGPYYRARPVSPFAAAGYKPKTDRPIEYALSLNDGRGPLRSHKKGGFAWYDPRGPQLFTNKGKPRSPWGYNTFTSYLAPRPGIHFIETTQELTSAFAQERTQSFLRGKGRTTVSSRRAFRQRLGLPIQGIDF